VLAIRMRWQHNGCMPSITIRNVPEETRAELAARAARSGRSLQEYLRSELLEMTRRPDAQTLLARVRARKESTDSRLPAAKIVGHRDTDRR